MKNKIQKIETKEILLAFYSPIKIYEFNTRKLVCETYEPEEEYYDFEMYEWECNDDSSYESLRLDERFNELHKIIHECVGKYKRIELVWDTDEDGYRNHYRIVGVNDETDEQFDLRVEKLLEKQKQKEKQKEEKIAKIAENKRKRYEQLKRELGK